jgi:thiol-disulfide isomerase/thioredoxin
LSHYVGYSYLCKMIYYYQESHRSFLALLCRNVCSILSQLACFFLCVSLTSFFTLSTYRYKGERPLNMVEIQTVEELEVHVQRADCLVVVEFFVPTCPGCKKLFPKIKQIANNNPDVKFVQV